MHLGPTAPIPLHGPNLYAYAGPPRPCGWCAHWLAWDPCGAARCGIGGRVHLNAAPATGCASWERAGPGIDDAPVEPPRRPNPRL